MKTKPVSRQEADWREPLVLGGAQTPAKSAGLLLLSARLWEPPRDPLKRPPPSRTGWKAPPDSRGRR